MKRHDYNFIQNKFLERGYNLLTKTYINAFKKMKYVCPNGHINWMNWNKFSIGRGCPDCKKLILKNNKHGLKHGRSYLLEYKREMNRKRTQDMPWEVHYYQAKSRCNNPKHDSYKWYGAKGIKFLLTKEEIKKLWFRDKAYLMEKPSIDRENSNKDYIIDNCQFMELSDNLKKMHKRYGGRLCLT